MGEKTKICTIVLLNKKFFLSSLNNIIFKTLLDFVSGDYLLSEMMSDICKKCNLFNDVKISELEEH